MSWGATESHRGASITLSSSGPQLCHRENGQKGSFYKKSACHTVSAQLMLAQQEFNRMFPTVLYNTVRVYEIKQKNQDILKDKRHEMGLFRTCLDLHKAPSLAPGLTSLTMNMEWSVPFLILLSSSGSLTPVPAHVWALQPQSKLPAKEHVPLLAASLESPGLAPGSDPEQAVGKQPAFCLKDISVEGRTLTLLGVASPTAVRDSLPKAIETCLQGQHIAPAPLWVSVTPCPMHFLHTEQAQQLSTFPPRGQKTPRGLGKTSRT